MDKYRRFTANNYKSILFLVIFVFFFQIQKVSAQQTIINVPSSEVLPAGDLLLKGSNRFDSFSTGTESSITPTFTLGIGKGSEISTGVATGLDSNRYATVRGNFAAKKVWFLGSSTRLTVGGSINPYYSQALHPDTLVYAHLSQRIRKTKTSLTAGGYMNGQEHFINTGGVILGLEQVLVSNKLRLALDWMSGQDSVGRFGVGLKYRPVPTLSVTTAMIIPNNDSDNIGLNFSVSKYISLDNENPIKRRLTNVD